MTDRPNDKHAETPKTDHAVETPKARFTKFHGVHVRTQDGRKIDRWTCMDHDGKTIEIDVLIIVENGNPMFIARSTHPSLRKMAWKATDISHLETMVAAGVEAEMTKLSRDVWRPGLLIEASTHHSKPSNFSSSNTVTVKLDVTSIMTPKTRQRRNDGMVEIVMDGHRLPVFEHGVDQGPQEWEKSIWDGKNTVASMIDRSRRNSNPGATKAAIDVDDQIDARVRVLLETLKGFGESMALSLSPDRIRLDGLPDGQALAAMLLQAAAHAEAKVAQADAAKE